jgi:hypothetical protein
MRKEPLSNVYLCPTQGGWELRQKNGMGRISFWYRITGVLEREFGAYIYLDWSVKYLTYSND